MAPALLIRLTRDLALQFLCFWSINVLKSLDQNLAPKKSNAEFPKAKGKSSDYIY